jgi:hypothetical protein
MAQLVEHLPDGMNTIKKKKKNQQPLNKWENEWDRQFSDEEVHRANEYRKKYSALK